MMGTDSTVPSKPVDQNTWVGEIAMDLSLKTAAVPCVVIPPPAIGTERMALALTVESAK
ncbi:MAG: hypothetical protein L6Q84_10120 [Polyangiaceae bacterium]|nr:hypothetical protein [Polyangiaceae bacterium]